MIARECWPPRATADRSVGGILSLRVQARDIARSLASQCMSTRLHRYNESALVSPGAVWSQFSKIYSYFY